MAQQSIFRPKALERLQSPSEHLDELMRVTSARGWIALAAALAVVVGVVLYGFFGTAATTVDGQGLFLPPGGLIQVQAPEAGTITQVLVEEGDRLKFGDPVATLTPPQVDGEPSPTIQITTSHPALVAEVLIDNGSVVGAGQEVITIEPLTNSGGETQTAVLYFPAGEGKAIEPGMPVRISPSTAPSEQYGQVLGRVATVSKFPVSPERVEFVVQNESLAQLLGQSAVLEVTVDLAIDPDSPSRLEWTSGQGPPFAISHGTLASASVILGEEAPASQLFGD